MPDNAYIYLNKIAPDLDIDYDRYYHSEQTLINPRLRELGFTSSHWRWETGDGDSFGPLTRCLHCIDPTRRPVTVVYG